MLATLAEAESSITPGNTKIKGQLTIGTPPQIAKYCLWPALIEFHQRYPDLHIDIQPVSTVHDPVHSPVDVYVLMGWLQYPEFVSRQIGSIRMLICASPGYWAAHGKPSHPRELAAHNCLLFRNPVGTVLDLWEFKQGTQSEAVTVNGWLSSSYRDILLEAILRGDGVARMSDTMLGDHLRSGRLVRVLEDWSIQNNPPIQVMYKPEQRRSPKVRAFVDFVTQVFAQLDADAGHSPAGRGLHDKPYWYDRLRRKASTARKS
jgi:DNA-binding transcriptional LysR family regulator